MRTRLGAAARRRWGLPPDPWEVRGPEDVWLGRAWRDAAEAMALAAETGGLMALIGESGSGKSTLRRYVVDRMQRERRPVRVIEPLTIDRSRLTASAICDAIVRDVSAAEQPRNTLEAKAHQVRRVLAASAEAGMRHVLIVEEAHDLHVSTLRYLKRFWELEAGFTRLLGVVLIAQTEMRAILGEESHEVREVVRRIEVVELGALDAEGELESYLDARIGAKAFAADACDAIRARLSRRVRGGSVSVAWPIATNNLVTRCLNLAAEMEQSQVTADTVAVA